MLGTSSVTTCDVAVDDSGVVRGTVSLGTVPVFRTSLITVSVGVISSGVELVAAIEFLATSAASSFSPWRKYSESLLKL